MKRKLCLSATALFCLAVSLHGQNSLSDSLAQKLASSKTDSAVWIALFDLSQYFQQHNQDSALQYAFRGLDFATEKIPDRVARSLNNIGLIYMNTGEHDKAMSYYFKSLEQTKKIPCRICDATTLGNIGIIFWKKKDYEKAELYTLKALSEHKQLKDSIPMLRDLNNLGLIYTEMGKVEEAISILKEAEALATTSKSNMILGTIYSNLGNLSYYKANYKEALAYYQKAISVSEKSGDNQSRCLGTINAGWAYLGMKDFDKAIAQFKAGEDLARTLKNEDYLSQAYGSQADGYKAMGDYQKALEATEKYMAMKDTLTARLTQKQAADLEAKYQTQQKEAQLANQQLELEHQANQKNRIIVVAILLLLLAAGLFQYFRNKQQIKQKEAEMAAQLEHAEANKLREMDALKSTFFANISHEFRTPLTLIISPLEQMMGGSFKGDFQKYYRIMHRNGKRLLDLVNQLLDLSKLESGKLKLEFSDGDLSKFVSAVAGSFESLAVRQQVDFQVDVPKEPHACRFDKDKVEKILVNLISNAFKFTGEGGAVRVRLLEASLDGPQTILVEDSGIGIPAAQLPHLFERFYHSSQSEMQAGSGLGLALTKELVELHGGTIEVESTEGKGTTFTIIISVEKALSSIPIVLEKGPITVVEDSASMVLKKEKKNPTPISEALNISSKPLLLIVEDNADVRSYIAETLAGDYEIMEADNGKTGLDKALETTPDLIITDVMMPEMNGTEFCKLLKINEKTSHIPVVMLTARAEQADKLEGLETGADDYLVKPFDARELQVRVANLLAGRQKLQEHFRKTLTFAAPKVEAESMDAAFLRRVREAVESNLDDEHFSVVELGHQIGMSRSQLHRKLSALTGYSPNQIIRNMRLEMAKQLLEKKAGNVSEVAFMTGFNSTAYFVKCFKDYYGMTPGGV